jgi:hypothetical protein
MYTVEYPDFLRNAAAYDCGYVITSVELAEWLTMDHDYVIDAASMLFNVDPLDTATCNNSYDGLELYRAKKNVLMRFDFRRAGVLIELMRGQTSCV